MLWISLCLVIVDAVFVVDANYCSCKGQDFTKGGEDCRVDDSHRWYEEGGGDEEDTEADKQNGKKNLMFHWRCEGVKVLRCEDVEMFKVFRSVFVCVASMNTFTP